MKEQGGRRPHATARPATQRGLTMLSLLAWGVAIAFVGLIALRVFPTVNEYWTILRTVNKVANEGGSTVPEIRAAFEKQKQIEYSITSVSAQDLQITKVNDKVVVSFAYDKQVPLFGPAFLLIKYEGKSK
ncbi:DUF4845 domain-containing protein [Caldimonas tepidiphila]|uniref:DUF4845 domain-containing protein n=1 Tax=Caldimonas tepidiphila TaxID=2315841 RepID=UPI000E5AC733|nr:DUF4845 domain-containing protein [Caldimonas tepidiphila]